MPKSTPAKVIGVAFVVAVVVALAQLGLATGLAILIWRDGSTAEWTAHLSWGAWLAAVATVAGSLIAGRLTPEIGPRIIAVLAAGIGGFVLAPLLMVPAMRFTVDSVAAAAFPAVGIGVLAGMVVAGLSLAWRAMSINVVTTIGLIWVLGLLAGFVPINNDSGIVKLAVWWQWNGLSTPIDPVLLVGALFLGMVTAWVMTGEDAQGDHRVTVISGAVGPLLPVVGYAAAGQPDAQVGPQWHGIGIAAGAMAAGLLGTLLVTALRRVPAPVASPMVTTTTTQPVVTTSAPVVEEATVLGDLAPEESVQTDAEVPHANRSRETSATSPIEVPSQRDTAPSSSAGDAYGTEFDVDESQPLSSPESKPAKATVTSTMKTKTSSGATKVEQRPEAETADTAIATSEAEATEPVSRGDSMDGDESWYSELRDDHAFINDHNEHPETKSEKTAKRRSSRKKQGR